MHYACSINHLVRKIVIDHGQEWPGSRMKIHECSIYTCSKHKFFNYSRFFVSWVRMCQKIEPFRKMSYNSMTEIYQNFWEKFGILKFWNAHLNRRVQFDQLFNHPFLEITRHFYSKIFSDIFYTSINWHFENLRHAPEFVKYYFRLNALFWMSFPWIRPVSYPKILKLTTGWVFQVNGLGHIPEIWQ